MSPTPCKKLVWLVAFMFAFAPALLAQGTTGSISGKVTDETGAVVPGVTVEVKNVDNGSTRSLVTDDSGTYRATALDVGNYEVRAELAGFQVSIRSGIELTLGRNAIVDLALKVDSEAQDQEDVSSARLVLGNDKTGPGGDAFVPIIFSSATTESVGTIIVEIRFAEKDLVFQEIKYADSETAVSATAEKDPNEPEKIILRVSIESKAGALASGIVGNLIFKVSDSVTFGEKILLPQTAQALSAGPSPKPVKLGTVDGQIDASAVPGVFSCFFYMH